MVKKKMPKTEKEWKDWGERFGEQMKQRGEDFAEEIEDIGERIGRRFEERRKNREEHRFRRHAFWFRLWPFAIIWPLIGSIFGLIILIIGIILLNWLNIGLGSSFVAALSGFLSTNLAWFFAAGLFFGYAKFFLKATGVLRQLFSPIIGSAGISFVAWIFSGLLLAINVSAKSALIGSIANFLSANLLEIFVIFLLIGYAIVIARKFFRAMFWD